MEHLRSIAGKPREAGSEAEREAAGVLASHFKGLGYDVETTEVEYLRSERLFRAYNLFSIWMSYALMLSPRVVHPLISVAILLALMAFEAKVLNRLYLRLGKDKSTNVVATTNPQGRARLIICGHYDSAKVLGKFVQRNERLFRSAMPFVFLLSVLYIVVMLVFGIVLVAMDPGSLTHYGGLGPLFYFWLFFGFLFGAIRVIYTIVILSLTRKEVSHGADDNASAIAVMMEVAGELRRRSPGGLRMRVDFACFAAEEKGLYGSRKWVNAHHHEMDRERTFVLNLDCVGRGERIFVNRGLGLLFKKRSDPELVRLMEESCEELGLQFEEDWGGSSDHYEFVQKKLRCVSVYRCDALKANIGHIIQRRMFGIPLRRSVIGHMDWIHTEGDTIANIDPERLEETKNLVLRFVDKLNARAGASS